MQLNLGPRDAFPSEFMKDFKTKLTKSTEFSNKEGMPMF